ncbi:MAG: hypothetical protein IID38_10230 [Planctomycetes bacterium]|nr:hypothetical protein [Planctomycetota bacterium]
MPMPTLTDIATVSAVIATAVRLNDAEVLLVAMVVRLELPATALPHARVAAEQLRAEVQTDDLVIYDAIDWPPDWIPQFYAPVSYYLGDVPHLTLLLRDPMSDELREQVEAFQRIIVVSPRIDAVPNPSADTHELAAQSKYIHQIGWIYLFTRAEGPKLKVKGQRSKVQSRRSKVRNLEPEARSLKPNVDKALALTRPGCTLVSPRVA